MSLTSVPDVLPLSVGSRERLSFRGVRRIKQFDPGQSATEASLEIREEVGSDSSGGYTIELVEVVTLPVGTDSSLYWTNHARSVDSFWSKRDFAVRDVDLIVANYAIAHLPDVKFVAGIACDQIEFLRYVAPGSRPGRYVVDFDPTTGLVLGWSEFDRSGSVLASSAYESFSYRNSLDDLTLRGPNFAGSGLDLNGSLDGQAGFSVLLPDLLPEGFDVFSVETFDVPSELVQSGDSFLPPGPWARMHATDGIESLSFAHGPYVPGRSGPADDVIRVIRQGSWDYGFGSASGVPFVVAGRVSPTALRQLVESAIR